MGFNIVLIEPEIPMNTGNIGRLSLAAGCNLHLVKPFGFEITDARVKRAGLDYWQYVSLTTYESIDEFFAVNKDQPMAFLSSRAKIDYSSIEFEENMFLIFGKESVGLPDAVLDKYADRLFKIPIHSQHVRSLNLANAVSVTVYAGLEQLRLNHGA